jgi:hypothetical protein
VAAVVAGATAAATVVAATAAHVATVADDE